MKFSRSPASRTQSGFSLIDVMMGSMMLVVGVMGMIQAVAIGSEMLATARRQTLAAQIINHEIEELRFVGWSTISGLSTSATTITIDSQFTSAMAATGVTYTLTRTVSTVVTNMREVTFTITWTKGGTTAAASTPTGSWLDRLSFARSSPISRTYTRVMSAFFTENGLNLSYQRT